MNVQLIKKEGKVIGWTITAETQEEKYTVNAIRNMEFFGLDDTKIVYGGRVGGDEHDAGTLMYVESRHKEGISKVVKDQL